MLETIIIGALSALMLSLALTPLIAWASRRAGYVACPRADRWHQKPAALFGGVGIFLAFVIPFAVLQEQDRSILFLMAGATIVFGLGVLDDLYRVRPYTKLVIQMAAASLVTFGSLAVPSSALALVVIPLAVFWLVGLTNAFNLLDNMDGLSAGTACIAAFFLCAISFLVQSWAVALCAAILCGATLGFLFYNVHPARIFMGDSGSMFLGFLLASLSMTGDWAGATNLLLMVLTPVLILAVPIFDTTFVTLVRWMNGRAVSRGGCDHTSHRLVAFGLSERNAVALFYLISVVCGSIAFLGVWYDALVPSLLGILMVIGSFYLGMFLNGVVTYGAEGEVSRPAADRGIMLDIFLMHKRRVLEVIVDVVLICVAYTASFVVRFEGSIPPQHFQVLTQSLPIILPIKLLVFSFFGLYHGVWRYVGMQDLIAIFKAVALGSVLAIAATTMLFRFELFPRSVFLIDWMMLFLLVAGVRVLIRVIREYLFSLAETKGERVVIVGAGDAGELLLRELRNNGRLGHVPLGFFDDDPDKHGRRIHGVPVLGGRDKILETVARLGVERIMVAIPSARVASLAGIIKVCESTGLPVTVLPPLADLSQTGVRSDALPSHAWRSQVGVPDVEKSPHSIDTRTH